MVFKKNKSNFQKKNYISFFYKNKTITQKTKNKFTQTHQLKNKTTSTALYDYISDKGQMNLNKGDIVEVMKAENGWFYVKCKEKQGYVPMNYIQKDDGKKREEITDYIANYDFNASNERQLAFKKDDTIKVLEKNDSTWWLGELNGKKGYVPSNYLKESPNPITATKTQPPTLNKPPSLTSVVPVLTTKTPTQGNLVSLKGDNLTQPQQQKQQEKYIGICVANHDFTSNIESQLSFKKNDTMNIIDKGVAWWRVELKGKIGMVPMTHVMEKKLENQNSSSNLFNTNQTTNNPTDPNRLSLRAPPTLSNIVIAPTSTTEIPHHTPTTLPETQKNLHCVALCDFDAKDSGQLAFKKGDRLLIVQKIEEGYWWKAELNGKTGYVPKSYVQDEETHKKNTQIVSENLPPQLQDNFVPSTVSRNSTEVVIGNCVALYDFEAKEDQQLTFKANDKMKILQKNDSWWRVELNGESGYVPNTYVKEQEETSSPSIQHHILPPLQINTTEEENIPSFNPPKLKSVRHSVELSNAIGSCVALYDFEAKEDQQLTFKANEKMKILQKTDSWWRVELNGEIGYVPNNYVKEEEEEEEEEEETTPIPVEFEIPLPPPPLIHTEPTQTNVPPHNKSNRNFFLNNIFKKVI